MKSNRYGLIDSIRGLVLLSMIAFHTCWDLVYIFGYNWNWFYQIPAYIWQQSICWTFIFLSGFCWSFGNHPLKRGLIVFGAGAVITLVTCLFMPDERVVFGILTCLGSLMIFMIGLDKLLKKVPGWIGFVLSFVCFILVRNINDGNIGFEQWSWISLPESIYQGYFMTYLGFSASNFYSTDYFSILPWIFLFIAGYFVEKIVIQKDFILINGWKPLSFLGRHSLIIYMIHQPLVYGLLLLIHFKGL